MFRKAGADLLEFVAQLHCLLAVLPWRSCLLPHLYKRNNNSIYLVGLSWGLNGVVYILPRLLGSKSPLKVTCRNYSESCYFNNTWGHETSVEGVLRCFPTGTGWEGHQHSLISNSGVTQTTSPASWGPIPEMRPALCTEVLWGARRAHTFLWAL